jgi:hypothetical protein
VLMSSLLICMWSLHCTWIRIFYAFCTSTHGASSYPYWGWCSNNQQKFQFSFLESLMLSVILDQDTMHHPKYGQHFSCWCFFSGFEVLTVVVMKSSIFKDIMSVESELHDVISQKIGSFFDVPVCWQSLILA